MASFSATVVIKMQNYVNCPFPASPRAKTRRASLELSGKQFAVASRASQLNTGTNLDAWQDILQLLNVRAVIPGTCPHPQLGEHYWTNGSGAFVQKVAEPLLHGRVPVSAKEIDPTRCIDECHSGLSATRNFSSSAGVMNVSERPNLVTKARTRPRRVKSFNAASTAARLVRAPDIYSGFMDNPRKKEGSGVAF